MGAKSEQFHQTIRLGFLPAAKASINFSTSEIRNTLAPWRDSLNFTERTTPFPTASSNLRMGRLYLSRIQRRLAHRCVMEVESFNLANPIDRPRDGRGLDPTLNVPCWDIPVQMDTFHSWPKKFSKGNPAMK